MREEEEQGKKILAAQYYSILILWLLEPLESGGCEACWRMWDKVESGP
jgi:hypothetical protein